MKRLLDAGIEVEVDSPDGYTKVKRYVEKGVKKIFGIRCNGKYIKASYDHLFETENGWIPAFKLNDTYHKILCDDGNYHDIKIDDINECADVVDLEVDNESHRYFTDGLSSHNTNTGKTLIMCSLAANMILQGKNVLYVTFEDSEEKIANRIMFNLLDADKAQLKSMSREAFMKRFENIKKVVKQKLIIKEFPEYSICANHLKQLFKDLKQKKKFVPEIMFIDYIGCMLPNGKPNSNLNSNDMLRLVAGQVRAIGMEHAMPVVSGAQTNRGGSTSAEIDLTDTADSFGQTMKADVIFGVTETPELAAAGMFTFFLLKNRFGIKGMKITVGVDKFKQRLYNILDESQQSPKQKDIVDDAVVNVINKKKSTVKNISFE